MLRVVRDRTFTNPLKPEIALSLSESKSAIALFEPHILHPYLQRPKSPIENPKLPFLFCADVITELAIFFADIGVVFEVVADSVTVMLYQRV